MILKQFYLGCLSHASYMIADQRTGVAAVVDPQRDIDQYVAEANANGWTIRYVFLTHFHADFLAGHIELRDRLGAHIYLGAAAQAEYAFEPVRDGDVIEFGDVRISIMETPGHTPEGISLLVHDLASSDIQPHAVLTGDTLFIGDVGRPDLLASVGVTADQLAEMLYQSVNRLRELPDTTLIYPAHGAGSMCGKALSKETVSTIGDQKRDNYALQPMSAEAFRQIVTADQPEAPEYFAHDAVLNRQDRCSLDRVVRDSLKPLSVAQVIAMQADGAQVIDVRESMDYEGAHFQKAAHIALNGRYATWCGTVLKTDLPIIVIAEPGEEQEAVMRLGRIGYDNVAGYLDGGIRTLQSHINLLTSTPRITAKELESMRSQQSAVLIVDVRSESEWNSSHIDGSLNMPLNQVRERAAELPKDRQLVVHCAGGYRSAIAVSLLEQAGYQAWDLIGGLAAWNALGLPATAASESSACTTASACSR